MILRIYLHIDVVYLWKFFYFSSCFEPKKLKRKKKNDLENLNSYDKHSILGLTTQDLKCYYILWFNDRFILRWEKSEGKKKKRRKPFTSKIGAGCFSFLPVTRMDAFLSNHQGSQNWENGKKSPFDPKSTPLVLNTVIYLLLLTNCSIQYESCWPLGPDK